MSLEQIPGRVFLDSSTLQTLQDYGEYIYDGGEIAQENKIWSIPNGLVNLEALRCIMLIGRRGSLQLVLFGYLSTKDAILIRDAVLLELDALPFHSYRIQSQQPILDNHRNLPRS
jgi:hypothetical protein